MAKLILQEDSITAQIFEVRGQKVMIDADLAQIYGVETKGLNQAVKRNVQRFPADFMFQLTEVEWGNLKSHFVTSSWGGRRTLPRVFTEHGSVMLASVLNSAIAIEASLVVVRAFVQMRMLVHAQEELARKIQELEERYDDQFAAIFETLQQLTEPSTPPREKIGFGRQDYT